MIWLSTEVPGGRISEADDEYDPLLSLQEMAVGQNLRYLFGDDYPPKVVYFNGFWDVHRGTGVLTHCQMPQVVLAVCLLLAHV